MEINAFVNPYNGGDVTVRAGGDIDINARVSGNGLLTAIDLRAGGDILFGALSAAGWAFVAGTVEGSTVFMRAGGELRLANYDTPSTITAVVGDIVLDVGRFTNLVGSVLWTHQAAACLSTAPTGRMTRVAGLLAPICMVEHTPPTRRVRSRAAMVFYRDRPTLTVTVGDLMRMYFERNPGQPDLNVAGLLFADTFDDATNGTTFVTRRQPDLFASRDVRWCISDADLSASTWGTI